MAGRGWKDPTIWARARLLRSAVAQSLDRLSAYRRVEEHLAGTTGLVADLTRRMLERLRQLTSEINALERDIADLVERWRRR